MGRSREQQREYMREYRARKKAEAQAAEPAVSAPSATPSPGVTPPAGRHAAAVERMLQESGLGTLDEEGPLVELLKDLAAELDREATARTRQQYLTALRDARKVLAAAPGSAGASAGEPEEKEAPPVVEPEVPVVDPGVTDFARFKRAKGGAAAG